MKPYIYAVTASITLLISSCGTKPHKKTEKIYNEQLTTLKQTISSKEPEKLPTVTKTIISIDTSYSKVLYKFSDTIAQTGARSLENGKKTEWIGTVNFNLRKPNLVIIHHTAQNALEQTIQTFTMTKTKVSSHYIIGKDGKVVQMLNDYLRAWHAGASSWGKITDVNSCSIGIELDNNGKEPFAEEQIISLMSLLNKLKRQYNIPKENILGHSDIAPTRKVDPSAFFPWKTLAENGFGLWKDENLETAPANFNVEQALRIIGYDTKNLDSAIRAFKLHYIQTEVNGTLDQNTINTIYSIYKKS